MIYVEIIVLCKNFVTLLYNMIRVDKQTIKNLKAVGLSRPQIAWVYNVCKRTVKRWANTTSEPGPQVRGRPSKILPLHAQWFLSTLRNDPYQTQTDLVAKLRSEFGLSVHRSTVSRFLRRVAWSKKVPTRAPLAIHEHRAEQWLQTFQAAPRHGKLMSLDETSFVVGKMGPSKGYSPRGQPIVQRHDPRARKTFSLLVCLEETSPAPVHWMLVEGAITGPLFQKFLETMPAHLQGNTLILDNAAIHHASKSLIAQNLPTIAETASVTQLNYFLLL